MEHRELRIHDIVVHHPHDWRISMKGLALAHEGNVDILGSGKHQIAVSLSWKPLTRYTDRFPTVDDYTRHVIENFQNQRRLSGLEIMSHDPVSWGGHPAVKLHLRFPLRVGTFKRKTRMIDRINLFTYCPKTQRALVVFISLSTELYEEERAVVWGVVDSVRCHPNHL